jgi:hypothetical protein
MGLGSEIRDPEKTYPGSSGQKGTGSRIQIRNIAAQAIVFLPDKKYPRKSYTEQIFLR